MGLPHHLTTSDYMNFPNIEPDFSYKYGEEHGDQYGELYLPKDNSKPLPVVVMIHGGCWQSEYGLRPVSHTCDSLREHGFAVWSLEYRRLGNGGGWPTTFLDIADGIDYLRSIEQKHGLDLTTVIATGHSAGGHLATWAAARFKLPETSELYRVNPLPVTGVVNLSGIPDLDVAVAEQVCECSPLKLMQGTRAEQPTHYAHGSPVELLPLGPGIRQHVVQGVDDTIVKASVAESFVRKARAAGETAIKLDLIDDAGHFEIMSPMSKIWSDKVVPLYLSFVA